MHKYFHIVALSYQIIPINIPTLHQHALSYSSVPKERGHSHTQWCHGKRNKDAKTDELVFIVSTDELFPWPKDGRYDLSLIAYFPFSFHIVLYILNQYSLAEWAGLPPISTFLVPDNKIEQQVWMLIHNVAQGCSQLVPFYYRHHFSRKHPESSRQVWVYVGIWFRNNEDMWVRQQQCYKRSLGSGPHTFLISGNPLH